jgi:hypothetical protein
MKAANNVVTGSLGLYCLISLGDNVVAVEAQKLRPISANVGRLRSYDSHQRTLRQYFESLHVRPRDSNSNSRYLERLLGNRNEYEDNTCSECEAVMGTTREDDTTSCLEGLAQFLYSAIFFGFLGIVIGIPLVIVTLPSCIVNSPNLPGGGIIDCNLIYTIALTALLSPILFIVGLFSCGNPIPLLGSIAAFLGFRPSTGFTTTLIGNLTDAFRKTGKRRRRLLFSEYNGYSYDTEQFEKFFQLVTERTSLFLLSDIEQNYMGDENGK